MTDDNGRIEFKYLIVNEQAKRFGLWVNTVGYQSIVPDAPYPLKEHPSGYFFNAYKGRVLSEYQIVYITNGCGQFSSGYSGNDFCMNGGKLMLLFPGCWHTYRPFANVGWTEYYIGFEGPVMDSLVEQGFFSIEHPVIDIGLNDEMVSLFQQSIHIAQTDNVALQQHLAGIVLHMLGLLVACERNKRTETSSISRKIEKARIYIKEHVCDNIDIEELAVNMNVSYSWFRKAFREHTGYAPNKYLHELKVQRAKSLLVDTPASIKEIASLLNYSSPEYFCSMFKKATGKTPNEYRTSGCLQT